MRKEFFLLFMFLMSISENLCSKFPNDIKKCSYGDSDCIVGKINEIFSNKFTGYNQLLLPSLDPIHIQRINLVQGPESKVNIVLNFMNIEMRGLSKAKVYKASGFVEPSKLDVIDFRFKTPKLMIDGPYKSRGKILILPIIGDGISHMHFDNVHFLMKFKARAVNRDGKTFLQLEKSKMTFNTTRLTSNFTNLFNGNEQLGRNMNKFMNENWKEILDDLKGTVVDGFGNVFYTIMKHVFDNFPYDEMFN